MKNARSFVEAGAAVLVTDAAAPGTLVDTMIALLENKKKLKTMSANMAVFARPDAVKEIAAEAYHLLNGRLLHVTNHSPVTDKT